MRRVFLLSLVLACVACAGLTAPSSSTVTVVPTTSAPTTNATTTNATTTVASTTTTAPPPPCPPAPYELAVLPPTVVAAEDEAVEEPDEFTSIGGTNTRLWVNGDDAVAIALVRGALPPDQFPAERGEVEIAGSRGVAGPYPDGRWVVTWFNEPGDRCDQYTMVFYPPVSPVEVEKTLNSMTRTPA